MCLQAHIPFTLSMKAAARTSAHLKSSEEIMENLRPYFITTSRPYREGTVEVFEQDIRSASAAKAILTITALGVYEAELNGEKIGDLLFTPGFTYYRHEVQVQEYDVTEMLRTNSVLRVYLGQGWYCGRFTFENKTQIYGERPAVSWVLSVLEKDGTSVQYTSRDKDVKAVRSPYVYAGLYDGEIYEADGADLQVFEPVPFNGILPENFDETIVSVRLQEEMPVKAAMKHDDVTILDFGQNFAGIIEINPEKMQGNYLKLRHGELLNHDGSLYTANLRKAKAEIVFRKGEDKRKYRPRFTYMGFRYAELSGVPYEEGLIKAYAVYSDMKRTGEFSCENKMVEQIYRNQVWGQKSNYIEVPTDCPQRDERMGYTGDGHVFALTGAYNFDTCDFWKKFLRDIRYSQLDSKEGYIAATIPADGYSEIGFLSMLGWGSCGLIVPDMLYWQYGSDEFLRSQYASMKAYVDCEIAHMNSPEDGLWTAPNLGDWLMMGKDMRYMGMHNGPVSNAFVVNDLRILSETARLLGFSDDMAYYGSQLKKSTDAYIRAYVEPDGSRMKDDYQGAYVMALRFVISKGDLWNKLFSTLTESLRREGMQTGFFATEHLLPMLAENGEGKLAYDILLSENCPGWIYQVQRGATTIWERWDAISPEGNVNETVMGDENMVSFNHYAFGSVGEFYYRNILGIRPLEAGYRKIEIVPTVDPRLGGAEGSYLSRAGMIRSSWKISDNNCTVKVEVPAPALITLTNGEKHEVEAGHYMYTFSLN